MSHWQDVHDHFRSGNVASAISQLEQFISSHEAQKFACVVGASFSNSTSFVHAELNRFVEISEKQFEVKAIYIEMNGFDINYDRWYFDLFAYSSYNADVDDAEWLCDWQSDDFPSIELAGVASAQDAFAWYHEQRIWESQPSLKPIYEASMLLILAKFADFIGSVLTLKKLNKCMPVLATAHGFEFVARFG